MHPSQHLHPSHAAALFVLCAPLFAYAAMTFSLTTVTTPQVLTGAVLAAEGKYMQVLDVAGELQANSYETIGAGVALVLGEPVPEWWQALNTGTSARLHAMEAQP